MKRFIGGFIIGLIAVVILWPRRRVEPAKAPHMTVFRGMEKCDPCQAQGEILQFRYGASHFYTENNLGEEIPGDQRRWIGRSWYQRCQDCHGHGERLRIWRVNGNRAAA